MATFRSINDFHDFRSSVRRGPRHYFDVKQMRFLKAVAATCHNRSTEMEVETKFYRAQRDYDLEPHYQQLSEDGPAEHVADEIVSAKEDRMRPLFDRASEGRVNPKGIAYFYCATEESTAIEEMRPWIGEFLTVAEFSAIRNLRIADCTRFPYPDNPFAALRLLGKKSRPPQELEDMAWRSIERSFSTPVTREDDRSDYSITQIVSEVIKSEGFDGILYRSSTGHGDGSNVALFDQNNVKLVDSWIAYIQKVHVQYTKEGPFF